MNPQLRTVPEDGTDHQLKECFIRHMRPQFLREQRAWRQQLRLDDGLAARYRRRIESWLAARESFTNGELMDAFKRVTIECCADGIIIVSQNNAKGEAADFNIDIHLSFIRDAIATIEHPDNQGGDFAPTVVFRRRLPSDPPPVLLDDTSI